MTDDELFGYMNPYEDEEPQGEEPDAYNHEEYTTTMEAS